MFGLTLGRLGVVGGLKKKFSPMRLFAASEVGAWYDPSDLSTMFQDRAGTTPVTADGQPVGLILDKSRGLVLGPELVTNGDFSNGSTGWSVGSSWTIATGQATTSAATDYISQSTLPSDPIGTFYKITITTSAITGSVYVGGGSYTTSLLVLGTKSYYISRTSLSNTIFYIGGGGGSCTITSVSAKTISGNHAIQATAAARPLKTSTGAADWTNYDAVDDVLNTTFPSSLGSSCTVCRANVGAAPTILTAQTIGTSYADSTDNAGLIIINRALTGQETTDVTAWLTAKGATL